MAIEQESITSRIVEVKIFGPYVKRWPEDEAVKKFLDLEEMVYKGIQVSFEPEAIAALQKDAEEGYGHAFYFDHQSHYDGRAAAKAVRRTLSIINPARPPEKRYKGVVAPVATSIGSGDQDPTVQKLFFGLNEKMQADGFYTIDFTRDVDAERYGLERTKKAMIEFNKRMENFIDEGFAPGVFPEARLDGGRKRGNGSGINGLQAFQKSSIRRIGRIMENKGQVPSFIPVAISGTYKVLSPERSNYRPPGLTMMKAKLALLTHGAIDLTSLVNVKVGVPVRWDEMVTMMKTKGIRPTDEAINVFLGIQLARMLPKNERGVFAGKLAA